MKLGELVIRLLLIVLVALAIGLEYSFAAGTFVFVSLAYQLEGILLLRIK